MTKNVITLLFLIISMAINGQDREEIISLMNEYTENYGKPNYSFQFVDTTLNPAIVNIEHLVCENNDTELFDQFIEMNLKTKGSADETSADILGGIFICRPELVEDRLKDTYKDEFLISILELGFGNRTFDKKEEIENYRELEKRLNRLLEME